MMDMTTRKVCPKCGSELADRSRRKWWMRLIPGSRRYRCEECSTRYLVVPWFGAARRRKPCPGCQRGPIAKHRRRLWMWVVPVSAYYRCRDCGTRFWRLPFGVDVKLGQSRSARRD